MTIGTDAAIEFFGTQSDLDSTSAAVADGAFSVVGDLAAFTNIDDALVANVILSANFSVAPDDNSSVSLFLRPLNIVSTSDQDVPTDEFLHTFVGSFPIKNVTTAQLSSINISFPNAKTQQPYELYVQNNTGQSMPAGWIIYLTPKAIGPHA